MLDFREMSKGNPFAKFFFIGLFSILMFFIGIAVRSYFAAQKEWKIAHETEAALLTRISLAWPEGKYIFCRYDIQPKAPARSTCVQCMLGGKEPITDFELCSAEMERQKKLAMAEELRKTKAKEKKRKVKKNAAKKRN